MTDESSTNPAAEADPQSAIDAQGERRQAAPDDRIVEHNAGDKQEGIPFVGAGPGDPRLLTVAGKELLEDADLVVHAGSLVNSELLDEYCAHAETVSSIGKDLEALIPLMRDAHEEGKNVVRLHSGDPAIYGAAIEQMDALEHEGGIDLLRAGCHLGVRGERDPANPTHAQRGLEPRRVHPAARQDAQ